jgi:hypothetical protein
MAGRPLAEIDDYFHDISTMYSDQGLSLRTISDRLRQIYSINISHQTLARRIQGWGFEKRQNRNIVRDPQLVAFVQQEWRENCSHQEIFRNISIALPHIQITHRQLKTLRQLNNIRYRRNGDISVEEEEAAKAAIQEVLTEHGGAYGRTLAQVALRQEGILVSQYNLRGWQRELDPAGMSGL